MMAATVMAAAMRPRVAGTLCSEAGVVEAAEVLGGLALRCLRDGGAVSLGDVATLERVDLVDRLVDVSVADCVGALAMTTGGVTHFFQ